MKPYRPFSFRDDVQIAPLRVKHSDAMYRWMRDPEVSQNIGLKKKPTLSGTRSWVRSAIKNETIVPFAILLSAHHVGNVVLDMIDAHLGTARLSVYVGESSARRKGVGFTASYLAIHHAFERLGLQKVWLTVHAENLRAMETYCRLGFCLEGILRAEFLLGQRRIPSLYMGLLLEEFRSHFSACNAEEKS